MTEPTAETPATAAETAPSDYVATTSFADLPLSDELRRALDEMGYDKPTPVQATVLGPILEGHDLICRSKTGTGKTAAFGIPLIERIPAGTRKASAMVLCNTRELAIQVSQELAALGKHKDVSVIAIYGGAPMDPQTKALQEGAEIIVGTPGRVYDHIRRGSLKLSETRMVVLDEADEMLSSGFYEEVTSILDQLPSDRQTLLFSATVPPDIEGLAQKYLRNPKKILLSGDVFTVDHIHNVIYYVVDAYPKPRNLLYMLERDEPESAIIFCNTKTDTELITAVLNRNGLDAEYLNGDLPQKERERVMAKVKRGEVRYMIATDIAARGIDISDLSHVVNYSLPEDPAVYLHRVGRTGRIGKKGTALSLVSGAELVTLSALEKKYGIKFEQRKLPTPEEAKSVWVERQMSEIRTAMQGGPAFEAYLPLAADLAAREDGKLLLAFSLKYFFQHHRMERAQMRAIGEKKIESHAVEKVHKEQFGERRKGREIGSRKPRMDSHDPYGDRPARPERAKRSDADLFKNDVTRPKTAAPAASAAPASAASAPAAPVDRVKLFIDQGSDAGWTTEPLAQALADLAGQPRAMVLALEVKPRNTYVVVKPEAKDAFLAALGKPLKEAPLHIEVALSSAEKAKRRRPDREPREASAPAVSEPHERLFLDQGRDNGWDESGLAQALAEAAGQPRESVLLVELRGRNAFASVKPEASAAFVALAGKQLKEKPLLIEVARKRR